MSTKSTPQEALEMEALLPCPFECGNEHLAVSRHPTSSYVLCDNCGAHGPSAYGHMKPGNDTGERDARAIQAWNTRATPSPLRGEDDPHIACLVDDLRGVIRWIKQTDPNATNYLYIERAIRFLTPPPPTGELPQELGASASPSGSRPTGPAPTGLAASRFDPSRWLVHSIAAAIDHPSVYMGGPSRQSIGTAQRILASLLPLPLPVAREAKGASDDTVGAVWNAIINCGLRYRDTDARPKAGDAQQGSTREQPGPRETAASPDTQPLSGTGEEGGVERNALRKIMNETGDRGDGLIDWQRCVDRIQVIARSALDTVRGEGM